MSDDRSQRPIWLGEDTRRWDHCRIHIALLADDRIGAPEIAVYVGLAAHAEVGNGEAFPSLERLGGYIGKGEWSVREAIKKLANAGWVEVIERPGSSNIYRLLPPPQTTGVGKIPPAVDRGTPPRKTAGDPRGGPRTNKNQEPDPSNDSISYPSGFSGGSVDGSDVGGESADPVVAWSPEQAKAANAELQRKLRRGEVVKPSSVGATNFDEAVGQ